MENRAKPAIGKIIRSDYIALLVTIIPLVIWGLYIAIIYFGFLPGLRGREAMQEAEGAPYLMTLGILSLVVCIPALFWRISSIQKVFANGAIVVGQITNLSFYRDRGRVEYTYSYSGQSDASGSPIHKTKQTLALRLGDQVQLVVDRENPKKALMQNLYI